MLLSEPARVLSLDPGERVGWARATVAPDGSWTDLRHGITPLRDMALAVHAQADQYDYIVFEDWRLYPAQAKSMIGNTFPSVQFIGMVKLAAWVAGTKLVTQGAKVKETADKAMKAINPELYATVTKSVAHDSGHDQDALRHLFYFTWRNTGLGGTVGNTEHTAD